MFDKVLKFSSHQYTYFLYQIGDGLFDLHLQEKSKKEHEKQVENILKKEKRKRKKIKDLGIDYDFPGYVSMQV